MGHINGISVFMCSIVFGLRETVLASCPRSSSPLVLTSGPSPWCVSNRGSTRSFCSVVATCHAAKLEMIGRDVYSAIKSGVASAPGVLPSHYWVGLTDSLNERATNFDGWVWIRDGQKTGSGSSLFSVGEPSGGANENCALASPTGLKDVSCRSTTASLTPAVFCYSNINGSDVLAAVTNSVSQFERVEIASYTQMDPGCWTDASPIGRMACSSSCARLGTDCVGFYWHSVRLSCILLTYFDSNMSLNFTDSADKLKWEKFLKKKF